MLRFVLRVVGIERQIGEREKERERERESGKEREIGERERREEEVCFEGACLEEACREFPHPCGNPLATEVGITSCCPDQITHCCVRC